MNRTFGFKQTHLGFQNWGIYQATLGAEFEQTLSMRNLPKTLGIVNKSFNKPVMKRKSEFKPKNRDLLKTGHVIKGLLLGPMRKQLKNSKRHQNRMNHTPLERYRSKINNGSDLTKFG